MCFRLIPVFLFTFTCGLCVEIGDHCNLRNGSPGLCRRVKDCNTLTVPITNTNCGFIGPKEPLICCAVTQENEQNNVQNEENNFQNAFFPEDNIQQQTQPSNSLGHYEPVNEPRPVFTTIIIINPVQATRFPYPIFNPFNPVATTRRPHVDAATTTRRSTTPRKTRTTTSRSVLATTKRGIKIRQKCIEYQENFSTSLNQGSYCPDNEFERKKHLVEIGYEVAGDIVYNCEGIIISENFILSSAQCTVYNNRYTASVVRLSHQNEKILIDSIIVHPDFDKKNMVSRYNDVALFRLARNISFGYNAMPTCIKNTNSNSLQLVSSNDLTGSMNVTGVEKIGSVECIKEVRPNSFRYPDGIVDQLVCTRVTGCDEGKYKLLESFDQSTCMHSTLGILSFNAGCEVGIPIFVFTRLWNFLTWIEDIVWP